MATNDENTIGAGIPAIIEAARGVREARVLNIALEGVDLEGTSISEIPMLVTPCPDGGLEAESMLAEVKAWRDAFATRPARREGTAVMEEAASFVAHALRFKDTDSAVFVTGGATSPRFTSVLDYHHAGEAASTSPRFGKHRGIFSPKFSPEWTAWGSANGKPLSQEAFAKLITDNVRDVLDVTAEHPERLTEAPVWFASRFAGKRAPAEFYASAARLLDLAEGLTVTVQDRVGDVSRRDSGETKITFESERSTDIEIPVAFVLEMPVFVGGDMWQIPVRLRFNLRTEGDTKRAQWRIELFGADRTVLACVAAMREEIAGKTALPIFAGAPE